MRFADMDARGHVNNAAYLTYFEIARRAFFEGDPLFAELESGPTQGPVLATQTCTYRRQLRYPATVDVGLSVGEIRTRSFRFEYGVFVHGTNDLVADGHTIHAWIDLSTESSTPLPGTVRERLRRLR